MDIKCSIDENLPAINDVNNTKIEVVETADDDHVKLNENNIEIIDIDNIKIELIENKIDNQEKIVEDSLEIIDNDKSPPEISESIADNEIKKSDNDTKSMEISQSIIKVSESLEINEPQVLMTDALRGIAAAYSDSSDNDDDDDVSCKTEDKIISVDSIKNTNYRCQEVDDTTDSEEDSSSSSSSSNNSSSECLDEANSDSDDENNTTSKTKRQKKNHEKGEYDDLPPIEDLKISVPEVLCDPVGQVGWMVDQMVVVTPKPLKPTLNIDTVLFIEKGSRVLGRIFDVFGSVSEPHYCIRFNNSEHIKENKIEVGMVVYYCPNSPYTTLVFMTDLLKMKATDDVHDDEHPAFSDDEEERAYYSSLKYKQANNKGNINEKNTEIPKKRARNNKNNSGWRSKHPWNNERPFQQQHHHYNQNYYNNMQQRNIWQYSPTEYNNWPSNLPFHNSPRALFNVESKSHNSSSFQSNVNFPQQPRPSLTWPNNPMTFTPTQIQMPPWRVQAPPPPSSLPSSFLPPPPPPGL